jgi:hypothetical protein
MSAVPDSPIASEEVVAVLLADGWHRVSSGTFTVGGFDFDTTGTGSGRLGFRFVEATDAPAYAPATLAGPLDALLAVRQVTPRTRRQKQTVGDTVTDLRLANGATRDMRRVGSG